MTLKRHAGEQLLRDLNERANLRLPHCVDPGKPRYPRQRRTLELGLENAMNGPDHYREAERLLEEAESWEEPGSAAPWCLELAKLHAALALAFHPGCSADRRADRKRCS